MSRSLNFFACTALFVLAVLVFNFPARAAEHSPTLDAAAAALEPGKTISVILMLDNRVSMDDVYPVVRYMPMDARRAHTIRTLKDRYAMMSATIMPFLENEKKSGRITVLRPLWIVNSIRVTLDPALIAEIDAKYPEVTYILNDSQYENTLDTIGWGVADISAPACWQDFGADGTGVIVGVKDSGCNVALPGFQGHLWVNPGEDLNGNGHIDTIEQNEIDDDGNGYVDDFYGWNFEDDNDDLYPNDNSDGHGNKTASVISSGFATDGNPCDTTSVAPGADLMILKAYNRQGTVWEASQYAVEQGANVISASLSFKMTECGDIRDCPNHVMHRMVSEMELAAGIIHANSTGDQGVGNPIPISCSAPSNCPPPAMTNGHEQQGGVSSMVSAAAYSTGHVYQSYSGHGPTAWSFEDICEEPGGTRRWRMAFCNSPELPGAYPTEYNDYPWQNGVFPGLAKPDVAAPTNVAGLHRQGYCSTIGGTSGACPHIGGVLALIYSAFPGITPEDAYVYLINGAVDQGDAGWDSLWGAGMLRPHAAILSGSPLRGDVVGTVRGPGDVLLPDVRVSVAGYQSVYSDDNGEYEISVLAGEHVVEFEKYGYRDASILAQVPAGGTDPRDVNMIAEQMGTVLVSVTGNGQPVSGAPVRIAEINLEEVTDANGQVTLDIYAGRYEFMVGSLPWAEQATSVAIPVGPSEVNFALQISRRAGPTGPDAYGYFIYDSYDAPEAAYNWVEINPNAGGLEGECLDITGEECALRNLPFTFSFYGQEFTSVRISANGFVEFGNSCPPEWGQFPIPATPEPNNYVAVLFTDWSPNANTTSCVYYLADAENSRAIVEWYNVTEYYDIGPARFQIILYDPEIMPTPTSDGAMKIQYNTLAGAYEAAVGVENATGTTGLEYYFQNSLAETASPVEPGMALLITTDQTLSDVRETPLGVFPKELALDQNYPNPFNSATNFTFHLPTTSHVKLSLFDLLGREVLVIRNQIYAAGGHTVRFDASELASGLYFARFESSSRQFGVRKVLLLK